MCDTCGIEELLDYVPITPTKNYSGRYNTIKEFSKHLRSYERFFKDYYSLELNTRELKNNIRKYRKSSSLSKYKIDELKNLMVDLTIMIIKDAFEKSIPICSTHALCMSCIEDDVSFLEPDDTYDDTMYRSMRRKFPKIRGEEFEVMYINNYIDYYGSVIKECILNEVGLDADYTFGLLVNALDLFRPVFVWSKGCC